jgi:uncharacterized protein YraI
VDYSRLVRSYWLGTGVLGGCRARGCAGAALLEWTAGRVGTVMSAMPIVLGHDLAGARWKVLHTRVAIRAGPSTRAAIIGVVRQGAELESCQQQNCWIRLAPRFAPSQSAIGAAWMLTDGKEVGLGRLLERMGNVELPSAKQSRWDWRVREIAPGRFKLLPPPEAPPGAEFAPPGDAVGGHGTEQPTDVYTIVHERVAIRAGPSTASTIIGVARLGQQVESCDRQGNWIRLARCAVAPTPSALYPTSWMMVDGKEVGLGVLLLRVVAREQS